MAKRIIHELVDDIDGTPAEETIRFALDGVEYEIDLSKKNAGKFWSTMQPYVEAGTKIGRVQSRPAPYQRQVPGGRAINAVDRERNREIRDWAITAGFAINDRGRIRGEIVQMWENRGKLDKVAMQEALLQYGTAEAQAALRDSPPAVPAQKAAPKAETNGSKPDVAATVVASSSPAAAAKKVAPAKKAAAAAK